MTEVHLEDFQRAGKRLQEFGDRKLVLAMRKDLRAVAKPVGDAMIEAIAGAMPKRGGLAERVRSQGRVSLLVDLRRGVRIQLANRAGMYMGAFESGTVRHPVYGNHKAWVAQTVPGNKGAEEFAKHADTMAAELAAKVEQNARSTL